MECALCIGTTELCVAEDSPTQKFSYMSPSWRPVLLLIISRKPSHRTLQFDNTADDLALLIKFSSAINHKFETCSQYSHRHSRATRETFFSSNAKAVPV